MYVLCFMLLSLICFNVYVNVQRLRVTFIFYIGRFISFHYYLLLLKVDMQDKESDNLPTFETLYN